LIDFASYADVAAELRTRLGELMVQAGEVQPTITARAAGPFQAAPARHRRGGGAR